jgi:hypothetical protein
VGAGGWLGPDDAPGGGPDHRVHLALHAGGPGAGDAPAGELRYRDPARGIELSLITWTSMVVIDQSIELSGTAATGDGESVAVFVSATDRGEPGRGRDTVRVRVPALDYDRGGTLGAGNVELH